MSGKNQGSFIVMSGKNQGSFETIMCQNGTYNKYVF